MTKEVPMPNAGISRRAAEPVLSFELRHSFVIGAWSFVIRRLRFLEKNGEAKTFP
jgi:hypothetical protein